MKNLPGSLIGWAQPEVVGGNTLGRYISITYKY